jgi:hypothetical protein
MNKPNMNYFSKIKLGAWLVIILTTINIAALGTIIYKNYQLKSRETHNIKSKDHQKGYKYFVNEMKLDTLQEKYFNASRRIFFDTSKVLFSKQEELRVRMIRELSKDDPDSMLLFSICDSMGFNYTLLKKLTMRNFIGFRRVCNTEQKHKLDTIYYKIILPEGPWNHKKPPPGMIPGKKLIQRLD